MDPNGPDGAGIVVIVLNDTVHRNDTVVGGPVACPPRSLNLKSLNFYPCGYLKSQVYEKPVTSCMDLVSRLKEAAACVRDTPAHFEQVRESKRLSCEACIVAGG
ncbi:hypothetical protein AVEN_223344-1 [Araneus ventricosus]|uniref:Uncharacterized protein n=1 Tax=Araneus ventricosus TaxID=182803 RepID=A0A4Y2TJ29_ARAVE|nr:hypothetical protein AVEN_223344-1 [Araneus ventricosus]